MPIIPLKARPGIATLTFAVAVTPFVSATSVKAILRLRAFRAEIKSEYCAKRREHTRTHVQPWTLHRYMQLYRLRALMIGVLSAPALSNIGVHMSRAVDPSALPSPRRMKPMARSK